MRYSESIPPTFFPLPQSYDDSVALVYRKIFKELNEMCRIRDFKLILCAEVIGYVEQQVVQELERAVSTEWLEEAGFDLSRRPLVTSSPQKFLPDPDDPTYEDIHRTRGFGTWYQFFSACKRWA